MSDIRRTIGNSPLLSNFFARREVQPLMAGERNRHCLCRLVCSRPSADLSVFQEKPPLPSIVVTPSTPSEERSFEYHFEYPSNHRSFVPTNYDDEDYDEYEPALNGRKTQSRWAILIPSRRILAVLAVPIFVVLVHVVILRYSGSIGDGKESV